MAKPALRCFLPALVALGALASCGGEIVAVLGFVGSAGGDWKQDDLPADGLQQRSTCGAGGVDDCFINIQPVGGQNLFASDFDLTFTSNLPGCPATGGTGRASGKRLTLTNCFTGQYVNVNQAVSDNGSIRMFFNFTPNLTQGIWVEIQEGKRRFVFPSSPINNAASGCELTSPASTPVDIVISPAAITNPAGPFETTIASFTVQGGGAAWQGSFVGVSGMRLTRGGEKLELERRQGSASCN